jgi:hypothetical protein
MEPDVMDRMTVNDLCDEIFNSRLEPWQTCRPYRVAEEPLACRECDAPLDSGEDTHCEDCQ